MKAYVDKSGDTIDWLEDMGVEWYGAMRHFSASEMTWHCPKVPGTNTYGRCTGAVICKALKDRADELGVRFKLETRVTSLIKEDDAIVGVHAVTADGKEIEARGSAVVIATGGFNKNPEMYKEYFSDYMGYELDKNVFSFPFPGPNGDGIRMAREVGAAEDNVNIEMYYTSSRGEEFLPLDIAFRQPNMLLNIEGKRFYNEGGIGNTTFTGNALYRQTGHVGYMFFDDATMRHYRKNGPDQTCPDHPITDMDQFDDEYKRYLDEVGGDDFIIADTLDEIAERIGMDPEALAEEAYGNCHVFADLFQLSVLFSFCILLQILFHNDFFLCFSHNRTHLDESHAIIKMLCGIGFLNRKGNCLVSSGFKFRKHTFHECGPDSMSPDTGNKCQRK